MPKENIFEHYSGKTKYVQKPKAEPNEKRCLDCTLWVIRKGITKDFWCKHMKHNLKFYRD
jgi:hypothetical protein